MKNILLCGLKYNSNYGDPIINDSCRYIVQKSIKDDVKIDEIDLEGKINFNKKYKLNIFKRQIIKVNIKILNFIKKCFGKIKLNRLYNFIDYITWYVSDEYAIFNNYYKEKIKNSDIIIFSGGGMVKYRYQNCYQYIDYITKIADKKDIPVCLNSVGVEGYDDKNVKCRVLKKALNRKCVKMITTRDDIMTLKKYICNENIYIDKVSDPAVFISDVYNIKKKENNKIIGLGVCRGRLFLDNKINYTEKQLIELWKKIIIELERRGNEWCIYTNGLEADNIFAQKLLESIKANGDNIKIPNSPYELVNIISGFKGIIATRLHSNIIAYSLQVPAIGLVWNNKLKMFGQNIGYPERFIEVENFDEKNIVDKMEKAIMELYEKIKPEVYRKSEENSINKFLNEFLENNKE